MCLTFPPSPNYRRLLHSRHDEGVAFIHVMSHYSAGDVLLSDASGSRYALSLRSNVRSDRTSEVDFMKVRGLQGTLFIFVVVCLLIVIVLSPFCLVHVSWYVACVHVFLCVCV